MKKLSLSVFVMAVCIFGSATAQASHYDLQDIEIMAPQLREKLLAKQIDDTELLLAELLSGKDREAFAKNYALSPEEVLTLAQKLELMQIPGIGPKAATLLQLAGISGVKSLANSDATQLLTQVQTSNRVHAITGVQPDIEVVSDWIKRAKAAIHLLQP